RHDVEYDAHSASVDCGTSRREAPFLTKAMAAKAASSASVKATSTAAGTLVTAPTSSRAAIPALPINCAAIMRSASPGPRRMRTSPRLSITRMKPSAAVRNSVSVERPRQRRLFRGQLRRDRLRDVEAVIHEGAIVAADRHGPGQQAGQRREYVARIAGRKADRICHESRIQRQAGMERASCAVYAGNDGLVRKDQRQSHQVD